MQLERDIMLPSVVLKISYGSVSYTHLEDFTININEKFSQYDGHIFIMASGIVIRKIASLIGTKDKDPAVLLIAVSYTHLKLL